MAICRPAKRCWQNSCEKPLILHFGLAWGKCQVIADVDSRDLEARSFNYTEAEKTKLNLSRVCLVKGNEQRARNQPCVQGLPHRGGHLAFLVALLANFTDRSCWKLLIFLAIRKDLPIGIMNRRCRKFACWLFEKTLRFKVLDIPLSDNGCMCFLQPLLFNFLLCVSQIYRKCKP